MMAVKYYDSGSSCCEEDISIIAQGARGGNERGCDWLVSECGGVGDG
jgi:hypothetical protein